MASTAPLVPESAPQQPSQSQSQPQPPPKPRPNPAVVLWRDLGISLAVLAVGIGIAAVLDPLLGYSHVASAVAMATIFAVMLLLGLTFVRALGSLVRMTFGKQSHRPMTWLAVLAAVPVAFLGFVFVGSAMGGLIRGRQLRRRRKVLLPDTAPDARWSGLGSRPDAPAPLRAALAAQWRENARNEHASVAAFAQLTLEMLAVGPPPRLLGDLQRDARDEIRHAELCFSHARALDGRAEGPAAFPAARAMRSLRGPRALKLARLAVDALVEGALLEGWSARVLARLSARCEDADTAALVRELAADEARHAKHGWDALRWCLAEGGETVAIALRGAAAVLPADVASSLAPAARDGGWEAFGIPGAALEQAAFADTRARTLRTLERILDQRPMARRSRSARGFGAESTPT